MGITISFDPNDEGDLEYIKDLLGVDGEEEPEPEEEATPAPKKAAPKKAAAKPEPEPEAGDGSSLEDAVARATELVAEGRAAEVKGALANFGVKRVSELEAEQVEEFLAALAEDSVV